MDGFQPISTHEARAVSCHNQEIKLYSLVVVFNGDRKLSHHLQIFIGVSFQFNSGRCGGELWKQMFGCLLRNN